MSIYRDRDRIFRDVHTFESIKETADEARKADTIAFYVKAGFDFHSEYETIYLG